MSFIVPMEKPKRCGLCPCFHAEHPMHCQAVKAHKDKRIITPYGAPILDRCPLIELPPHGRLIDADKFAETLKEVSIRQGYDKLFSDNILSVGDVFDAIAADLKGEGLDKYKYAPTVIEAEGSGT